MDNTTVQSYATQAKEQHHRASSSMSREKFTGRVVDNNTGLRSVNTLPTLLCCPILKRECKQTVTTFLHKHTTAPVSLVFFTNNKMTGSDRRLARTLGVRHGLVPSSQPMSMARRQAQVAGCTVRISP